MKLKDWVVINMQGDIKYGKNIKNFYYYIIYILFVIEIIFGIKTKYVTGDESFTLNMIHHNFFNIINLTSQDVHPFLYYFISKTATYNINNLFIKIFILRLISELPYLILLIIGNTYIKKVFSSKSSKVFMFSILTMPTLVNNISILRMYGWSILFVTIFYILFINVYINNDHKHFIFISLFALLASYTHYYALLVIAIIYISFLILFIVKNRNIKYLLLSVVIDIILYFPWLIILLRQTKKVSQGFWTNKLYIKDVIHMTITNFSPVDHKSLLYILPLLFIFSLLLIIINKNIYKNGSILIGILTPFILIIVGFIISILVHHSVLMSRYISISMGVFWLSISILINNINYKYKIIKCILSLILIIGTSSYCISKVHDVQNINNINKTLSIFSQFPKNSIFIYNDRDTMGVAASYLNNNYVLKDKNDDPTFIVYNKVFNNIREINNSNIPKHLNNVFYFEQTDDSKKNINTNRIINTFNKKYNKKKINDITIDNVKHVEIYKIIK